MSVGVWVCAVNCVLCMYQVVAKMIYLGGKKGGEANRPLANFVASKQSKSKSGSIGLQAL
jgi:hypothetical protein